MAPSKNVLTPPEPVEIEANRFASELLMPTRLLKRDLKDMEIDLADEFEIKALAKRYKVSSHAMSIRVSKLVDSGVLVS